MTTKTVLMTNFFIRTAKAEKFVNEIEKLCKKYAERYQDGSKGKDYFFRYDVAE